jgi:hypothetical protein
MKKTKILFLLGFICLSSAVFYSCKKTGQETISDELNITKEEAVKRIKAAIKDKPQVTKYNLGLPGKGFYSDINGNKIDLQAVRQNRMSYDCLIHGMTIFQLS